MEVPHLIIHFSRIFHEINHPAESSYWGYMGIPHLWKPPGLHTLLLQSRGEIAWMSAACPGAPQAPHFHLRESRLDGRVLIEMKI